MSDDEDKVVQKIPEETPRRRPKKIFIPHRKPSVIIPERETVFITADKLTCDECPCFPKEDPYVKPKKLKQCQHVPLTLYELAAYVVDHLKYPDAFKWSAEDVANWMERDVGFPDYRGCIMDNHIDGLRLLMLEDPSKLTEINIHNWDHIKVITAKIRQVYSLDFIRFARSVGLPPRRPGVHCTWFKSRTGPSWGIRQNWTRCDILKWMKIIMPEPIHMDHWDLVWYQKPDFPKVLFARTAPRKSRLHVPMYKPTKEVCNEFKVPRKFRLEQGIKEEDQYIWMEKRPEYEHLFVDIEKKKETQKKKKAEKRLKFLIKANSNLYPKKVDTTGLAGKDLILARRKMARPKFLVN